MRNNISIKQIATSGVLVGLAVLLGAFARFPLFGGNVYLVGVIIFLMPLMLKYAYALASTLIAIVLTDLIGGWIAFTWISMLAYGTAVSIIYIFSVAKSKFIFIPGLIFGSMAAIAIYYFMELAVFDHAIAISDLYTTSIQFAIIIPIVALVYTPIKIIGSK